MSTIARLFGINQNKTAELTTLLFTPCFDYLCNRTEDLYQKTLQLKGKSDEFYGMYIGNIFYYRPESKILEGVNHKKWISIDESLIKEGFELEDFLLNVRNDVRFIQMWLSLVIDTTDPIATRAKLPTILANQHSFYKNVEFNSPDIPKGREHLWKKAEETISFYLGLKLIL